MIQPDHIVFTMGHAVFCGLHPDDAEAIEHVRSQGLEPVGELPEAFHMETEGVAWVWFMKSFEEVQE